MVADVEIVVAEVVEVVEVVGEGVVVVVVKIFVLLEPVCLDAT